MTRSPANAANLPPARSRSWRAIVVAFGLASPAGLAHAQDPAGQAPDTTAAAPLDPALSYHSDYLAAMQALSEGLPGVAAAKLARVLEIRNLPDDVAARVRIQLAEAHVRSGNPGAALETIDGEPPLADSPAAVFWRAQALAGIGRLTEALTETGRLASLPPGSETANASAPSDEEYRQRGRLLESRLLFGLGQAEPALQALQPLLAGGSGADIVPEVAAIARIRAAEIHLARRRAELAATVLADLQSPPPRLAAHFAYLKARIALAQGDSTAALAALARFPQDSPIPPEISPFMAVARASALNLAGRDEEARVLLRTFVSENATSALLGPVFALLDQLGGFATPEGMTALENWAASTTAPGPLSSLSQFYRATALAQAGDRTAAIPFMQGFLQNNESHPLAARGRLELVDWLISDGQPAEANRILGELGTSAATPGTAAHIDFLRAKLFYEVGDYNEAGVAFERAAAAVPDVPKPPAPDKPADPAIAPPRPGRPAPANGRASSGSGRFQLPPPGDPRTTAAYNAAIAALKSAEEQRFQELAAAVAAAPESTTPAGLHAMLLLERALYLAATGSDDAAEALQRFLTGYPEHPEAYRAHMVLAELALLAFPPRPKSAQEHLEAARGLATTNAARQQLDYLAVWIAESAADYAQASLLGEAFLQRWTSSPLRDDVLMKLGQMHYRREDYPNAQRRFELLAAEEPNSPFAETALFFAGKASLLTLAPGSLDTAITLWEKVVSRGGPLRLFAREQQALALRRLGREVEAAQIIDSILSQEQGLDPAFRFSLLIAKGETLVSLGSGAPNRVRQAIDLFDTVARHPNATTAWRREALYRKGKALETLGSESEALEAYYDALGSETSPGLAATTSSDEHLWLYRAGFEAVRILENRRQWKAAVTIAERLANAGGPRASEARSRAERIRLEQFLWDGADPPTVPTAAPAPQTPAAESGPGDSSAVSDGEESQ